MSCRPIGEDTEFNTATRSGIASTAVSGGRIARELLEASPGFLNLLVGKALGSRPGFRRHLAILGDGLPDDPAGNGLRGKRKQHCRNHHDDADHLPSIALMPSHTAPTKPVTIMVITALKV